MSHRQRQPKSSNKDYGSVDGGGRGHVHGKHRGGGGASDDVKEDREGRDSRKRSRSPDPPRSPARRERKTKARSSSYDDAGRRKSAGARDSRRASRSKSRGHENKKGSQNGIQIRARDHSFKKEKQEPSEDDRNRKTAGNRNNESGYGSELSTPSYGGSSRGNFNSYRGSGVYNRGQSGGYNNSTPVSGRIPRPVIQNSGGKANDFLANRCIALEKQNAALEKEMDEMKANQPKGNTGKENLELQRKLDVANTKLVQANDKNQKLESNKYKHNGFERNEAKLLQISSEKVKKCIKPLMKEGVDVKDIKHGLQLLFSKLDGKPAWEEIIRMVRSVGVRKNIEGLVKGLRKFLKESSESESEGEVESSPDMFAGSDEERERPVVSVEKTAEPISDVSEEEPVDKKVKKKDSKPKGATNAKAAAKSPVAKPGKSPKAGTSGTSKFAEKRKSAFNKRAEISKKKQDIENGIELNDDEEENLDTAYNGIVLKRDGSPNISAKKGAPNAPKKIKIRAGKPGNKVKDVKKRSLVTGYKNEDNTVYVKYSMQDVVIRSVLGKLYSIKDMKADGNRILDKNASDLAAIFKCGFWPQCGGTVGRADSMVRGGMVIEPYSHKYYNQFVYICAEHGDHQAVLEDNDEGDSDAMSIELKKADLCEDSSDMDSEKEEGTEEDKDSERDEGTEVESDGSKDVETSGEESDGEGFPAQSQSLLLHGGQK